AIVRRPFVGHRAAERDHALEGLDLLFERLAWRAGQTRQFRIQHFEKAVALLGDQLDAVRRQKLVVADRARDRAAAGPSDQSGLRIVVAEAASLEGVDANRLLARQAFRSREARISALEG